MDSSAAEPPQAESPAEDVIEGSFLQRVAFRLAVVPTVVAALLVLVDQLSKSWAVDTLADGSAKELFAGIEFRLAYNTGMAFSQGQGAGWLIGIIATVVALGLIIYSTTMSSMTTRVVMGLVAGGALGNVMDRLFRPPEGFMKGAVVDFIYTSWWPTFNIADSAVVVGAIVLVVLMWREDSASRSAAGSESGPVTESGTESTASDADSL